MREIAVNVSTLEKILRELDDSICLVSIFKSNADEIMAGAMEVLYKALYEVSCKLSAVIDTECLDQTSTKTIAYALLNDDFDSSKPISDYPQFDELFSLARKSGVDSLLVMRMNS